MKWSEIPFKQHTKTVGFCRAFRLSQKSYLKQLCEESKSDFRHLCEESKSDFRQLYCEESQVRV